MSGTVKCVNKAKPSDVQRSLPAHKGYSGYSFASDTVGRGESPFEVQWSAPAHSGAFKARQASAMLWRAAVDRSIQRTAQEHCGRSFKTRRGSYAWKMPQPMLDSDWLQQWILNAEARCAALRCAALPCSHPHRVLNGVCYILKVVCCMLRAAVLRARSPGLPRSPAAANRCGPDRSRPAAPTLV